jgi:hypothetical protein
MGPADAHYLESIRPMLLSVLRALPEDPERVRIAIDAVASSTDAATWRDFVSYAG